MLLVGLTGGIGSGKSTVAHLLEERGAALVDADHLARMSIAPGTPGHDRVLGRFGSRVLTDEGAVDREALAGIVFSDPEARADLEAIVHPEVARLMEEALAPYRETGRIVVYLVPLLVERGLAPGFDVVVTVRAREDVRVARLAADRGMREADARARMAAQVSDADRERVADVVVDNDGSLEDLELQVDELWRALVARASERSARGDRGSSV